MSGFLRKICVFLVFVVACFAGVHAANGYTYTLNDDGAKVASVPHSFTIGSVTQLSSLPYKPGYGYGGHYTGQHCQGTQIIDYTGTIGVSLNANTTLYACWRPMNSYWMSPIIVLDDDGGAGGAFGTQCGTAVSIARVSGEYVSYGGRGDWAHLGAIRSEVWWESACFANPVSPLTAMAQIPTRQGFIFRGYYTGPNGSGTQVVYENGNLVDVSAIPSGALSSVSPTTIYAYWTSNTPTWATVTINDQNATTSSQYSVLYININGSVSNCFGYRTGQSCTALNVTSFTPPTKTGYTYGGHYTQTNGGGSQWANSSGVIQYSVQDSRTVYAQWTPNVYTVTLNHGSPTNSPAPSTVYLKYGTGWYSNSGATTPIYAMTTVPQKTNYTFGGYWTGQNGTGTRVIDSDGKFLYTTAALTALTSNATIYAYWTAATQNPTWITVTFDDNSPTNYSQYNGGRLRYLYRNTNSAISNCSGYKLSQSCNATTVTHFTPPTKSGYTYGGHYTGSTQWSDASGNILVNLSANTTVTAQWTQNSGTIYTVTLYPNGGTACATTQVTATYGSPMPALSCAPTAPTGHHFNGYFDATSGGTQYYYADLSSARNWDKTGAQTLYAQWVANTYTVKYYCDKEEYELGTPSATDNATYGQSYVVKTRAAVGCTPPAGAYKFMGWSYGSGEDVWQPGEIITYNFTEDKDAMGWYMEIETVTLNHGSPDNSPGPNTVYFVHYDGWYTDSNATMEATVSPVPVKYGYDFLGYWTTATSGGIQIVNSNGQFITTDVNAPATIYARYGEKIYQIALDDQNATTAGAPTPLYYSISNGWSATSGGTTITQITTAPTKTGYAFNGYWTQTGGTGTKIINADRTFATVTSAILQAMHNGEIDTLYADWLAVDTVTFSCQNQAGDGSGTPSPATVQVADGETLTFPSLANCSWGNAGYSPYLWGYVVNGSFVETHEPGDTITWDSGWGNRTFNVWYAPNYFNYEYSCGAGSGTPPASGNTYYHNGGWTTAANTCTPPANKHFTGWLEPVSNEVWAESTVPTNGYRWPYDVTAAAGGAFVAQYADDTYTATFTCENNIYSPYVFSGTAPESITNISYNQTITLPSPSVCTNNYPDAGWIVSPATQWSYNCVDGNGGAAGNGSAVGSTSWPAHGNCTFRPMALMSSYDITYDCNGGTGNAPAADTVNYTNRNTARPAANTCTAPTGHHFTGWQVGTTSTVLQPGQYGGSNALWPYTQNITLRAQWEADTYNLTWGCGDGTGTPSGASYPTTIDYGETLTFPTNTACTAPTGYEFAGWTIDANTTTYQPNGTFTWNLTSGSEINASFTPIKVNITYSCGTGASGTAPAAQNNIDYGSQVTLRTLGDCAMNGFYATRWLVSNTSPTDNYEFGATVDHWNYIENKNLVPNWTAQTYTITYYDEDGTTVLTGLNPTSYTYGTGATINAVPTKAHSTFAGWCDTASLTNCTMTKTIGATATGDKTYYAKWNCAVGYEKYDFDTTVFEYDTAQSGYYPAGSCAPGRYHVHCDGNGGIACLEQLDFANDDNGSAFHFGQVYGSSGLQFSSDVTYGVTPVHSVNSLSGNSYIFTRTNPSVVPVTLLSTTGFTNAYTSNNYVTFINYVAQYSGVTPWRAHYTFNGLWTDPDDGEGVEYIPANGNAPWTNTATGAEAFSKFFTSDATVYAHWKPDVYTITLNLNDGSGGAGTIYEEYESGWSLSSTGTFVYPMTLGAEQTPSRSGYTFTGWYDDPTNGTLKIPASGVLPAADTFGANTTLYAHWTANTYVVTYDCNADGTGDYSNNATYDSTYTVSRLSDAGCAIIIGHSFGGWAISGTNLIKSGGDTFTWNYTEPKTLTAQWTPNVYHITFDFNNNYTGSAQVGTANMYEKYGVGWGVNESGGTGSTSGELWSDTVITLPRYAGHTFVGYYDNTAGTGTQYVGPDAQLPASTTFAMDKTLYAVWSDCTPGNYCDDGQVISCSTATNGKYPYSDAGATSINDCYLTLTPGNYVATAGAGAVQCVANSYCDSTANIYYGGTHSASHMTTGGITACATGAASNYSSSVAGSDANTDCYKTVTLNKNGGSGTIQGTTGTNPASVTCYFNTSCDFGSASGLAQTGYTFTGGWGTSASCSGTTTSYTVPNDTDTYYACKSTNCNAITVDNTTRGGSTANTTLYKKSGDTKWFSDNSCQTQVTTTPAPSKTNATFAGYYLAPDNVLSPVGSSASPSVLSTTLTVTAAATIYAHYNCDTHYTQGGTDIAGACNPDVYNINYEFNGGSALPAGYTRVEYIQGNGSSYIDTGVVPSSNYIVQTKIQTTGNLGSGVKMVYGARNSYKVKGFGLQYLSKFYLQYNNVDQGGTITPAVNTVYNIEQNANKVYVNGTRLGNTPTLSTFTPDATMSIFGMNNGGTTTASGIFKLFGFVIKDANENVKFNGIPVKYNNVCGLYDTVSKTFLPSATGTALTCPNTAYTGDYPTEYTYGVGADITGVPTRAHSQFVGWCTNSGLTNNCVTPQSVSTTDYDDKTFYAKWSCDTGYTENAAGTVCEANTITIKLNKNGGTGTCGGAGGTTEGTLTCTYDGACTAPSWNATTCNINNGSKIFTGWNMQSNGGGISYAPGASIQNIISSGTTRLYAMWSDVTCDITNGGGTASNTTTNTPTCAVTCDTGYGTSGTYTGTAGTTTVSYTCAATDYTMQYLCSDGEAGWNFAGTAPTATNPVHYGDNVTLAADPYNSQTGCRKIWNVQGEYCDNCFTFGGWTIDAESAALEDPDLTHAANSSVSPWGNTGGTDWCIVNTTGVCSAYSADDTFLVRPQYTPKQYDITYMYATSPVDNNASMPADYTYTVGTSISNADQTPPAHATFNGWCTGANGTGTCYNAGQSITIGNRAHGDITYYANWSCGSGYTLTYDANNQPVCSADAITCPATQYLPANATTCVDCTAGNYCPGGSFTFNETTAQGIYVCTTNTYSNNVAAACTACATANGYTNSGSNAADHAYESSCKTTCSAGQCVATARAACANVGPGGWATGGIVSQGSTLACNVCPTGLTTIGYGAGADEADDCGRVLHLGENHMYLRGASKTNPSLHVKVGDTVFYGNMSTSLKNMSDNINKKLRLKYNDTTYSVYDDSVAD